MSKVEMAGWGVIGMLPVLVLGLLLCSMTGCEDEMGDGAENNLVRVDENKNPWVDKAYDVVVIEGCEYLVCRTHGGSVVIVHKGNCKNQIHNYKEIRK